jgi:hypothetical protein
MSGALAELRQRSGLAFCCGKGGKLNYPLCGSVWFDLWSFVCACALMHDGCDSRNLCGFGIFCACSRVF